MKLTQFIIVIVAALMFLVPRMREERSQMIRQAQEESPIVEVGAPSKTFRIIYKVNSPEEEPIADIIWMKKAAAVAKDAGVPYFNVLEQNARKRFVKEYNSELSVVEGTIELEKDPMRAEFDAVEIESLVLTEIP